MRMLLAPTAALLLAACTAEISEDYLLRPVAGGSLSAEDLAKAAPVYSLTRHSIAAPDGARLHAVLLRQAGARATVLYFGGNGYVMSRFGAWTASVFAPLNVDLMLVDHRGYGLSEGRPTAEAMEADGLAVFDYLSGLKTAPIVLHGQSLGSFTAGHVAAHRSAAGVVLESSATTTEDWVKAGTPGAAKPFMKVRIADNLRGRGNLENMPRIEEPLLILVGAKDSMTPPRLSQALHAASTLPVGRKTLAVVPRAGHNDVMTRAEAITAYRAFLDRVAR